MVTLTLNLAGVGIFLAGAATVVVGFGLAVCIHDAYYDRKQTEELIWEALRNSSAPQPSAESIKKARSVRYGTRTYRWFGKPFAAIGWLLAGWRTR